MSPVLPVVERPRLSLVSSCVTVVEGRLVDKQRQDQTAFRPATRRRRVILTWAFWGAVVLGASLVALGTLHSLVDRHDGVETESLAVEGGADTMEARPVLKQFGDLVPADFQQHPVWIGCHTADYDEPWYDETDEETFRPWTGELPAGPEEGMLLVRATFTIADGRVFVGFVTPQHQGEPLDLGLLQPALFLPSGELVQFWCGIVGVDDSTRRALYDGLGASAEQVFPIRFTADQGLTTGQASGTVPGFCCLDGDDVRVHL